MYSRQSLLGLSIAVSLLLHAGLLAVAPRVTINSLAPAPQQRQQRFHVQLRTETMPPQPEWTQDAGTLEAPMSIEEMLRQEIATIDAIETLLKQNVEIPQLTDRLASEIVERDHYLEPDPAILSEVDGRIIEISQEIARQDIEIARRLVTPSSNRIVGPDEFPALRGSGDTADKPITVGSLPARSLIAEQMQAQEPAQPREMPPFEASVNEPAREVLTPPAAVRQRVAPVIADIQQEAPFEFMDDLLDVRVSAFFPPQETMAYFSVEITPKPDSDMQPLPKDVTFIIDASASMAQHKLNNTVRGTSDMVRMLRPEDRFNIVVFRDTANNFRQDLVPATPENKDAAVEFLNNQEARGGTDIYNAIRPVVESAPRPGAPGLVFLMSDGRPTSGVRDARTIINRLTNENVRGKTIFAHAGGRTINQYLLDLLAYMNKGESRVVPSIGDIDSDLPAFFSRLNEPLLVKLDADFGNIDKTQVFPKDVPDFYKNRPVTLYGRFDPSRDTEFFMRLTGTALDKSKEVIFQTDLRDAATGDDQIARRWAFQKIYFLISEICRVGEKPELMAELRELSRRYNIRTSYD